MNTKEIKKVNIEMPKSMKKNAIYCKLHILNDCETACLDFFANKKFQIRYCFTSKDYGSYIPEDSDFIGREYNVEQRDEDTDKKKTFKAGFNKLSMDALDLSGNLAELTGQNYWSPKVEITDSEFNALYNFIAGNEYSEYSWHDKKSVFGLLRTACSNVSNLKKQKKAMNEHDKMMADFKLLYKIPKKFEEKAENFVKLTFLYMEPFGNKKVTKALCSHCKNTIEIERGKTRVGQIYTCPSCKAEAIVKPYKSIENKGEITKSEILYYLQKTKDGGSVIRDFYAAACIKEGEEYSTLYEISRYFVKPDGTTKRYTNKWNGYMGDFYWDYTGYGLFDCCKGPVANDTRGYVFGDTKDFAEYGDVSYLKKSKCSPQTTMNSCKNDPVRTILADAGLSNLAVLGKKTHSFKGDNLEEILGLNKKNIRIAKKNNPTFNEYLWMQWSESHKITESDITWFVKESILPEHVEGAIDRLGVEQTIKLIKKAKPTNKVKFAAALSINPTIEYLLKANMDELAVECVEKNVLVNMGVGPMALGINREEWNRLKKYRGNVSTLRWLQYENKSGVRVKDEVLQWAKKYSIDPAEQILKYTTPLKAMNYCIKQTEFLNNEDHMDYSYHAKDPDDVWKTWRDYISMGEKIKMNFEEDILLKPKDVQEMHDMLANEHGAEIKEIEILEKFPHVNEILSEIKDKYAYSDKEYAIVVPTGVQDIIAEGTALGHCLDKQECYFDYINKRESFILFLRRKSEIDKPWYTLEVEPDGSTRQKRTTGDKQNDDYQEAVKFIKKWQRQLKRKLTSVDYQLQQVSNMKREALYAQYEAEKRQVWHGPFAGQPLAKLLREDYLPAVAS